MSVCSEEKLRRRKCWLRCRTCKFCHL